MSAKEMLYIDDGGLVYYINENEFITCDEIPYSMLEGIKHLQQKVEQLENIRKEAIEYINKNWGHWCSNHCKYATETINILNKGSEDNERN